MTTIDGRHIPDYLTRDLTGEDLEAMVEAADTLLTTIGKATPDTRRQEEAPLDSFRNFLFLYRDYAADARRALAAAAHAAPEPAPPAPGSAAYAAMQALGSSEPYEGVIVRNGDLRRVLAAFERALRATG